MSKVGDTILYRGEKTCPWWICFTFDNPLRTLYQNPGRILSSYLKPGYKVLDIGPGQGYFTFPMSGMVSDTGEIVALDIQDRMLKILSKKAEKRNISNVRTVLYDGREFKLDAKFDFILMFWMFHEVREKENFMAELRNVCKKETKILFAEPVVHVTKKEFDAALTMYTREGFAILDKVDVGLSRAVLLGPG